MERVLIQPRVLKGFRDSLPAAEIARRGLIERLEGVFRQSGFVPIDTPALEYAEILLGKGGGETEKQVYRFADNGQRDVALRFDLTVPFARFMAEHASELYLPFKRYHIAKVWRGENTQKGRYREFYQCDFDCVGQDNLGADLEVLLIAGQAMRSLEVNDYKVHFSHRGLFNRFLTTRSFLEKSVDLLRLVDKLHKIGRDEVASQAKSIVGESIGSELLDFIDGGGDFETSISRIERLVGGPCPESQRLRSLMEAITELGLAEHYRFDPSITRGLDYYTGLVFETFLEGVPDIGSVCSGGRYDDLGSLYQKQMLSGVGGSVGLDRLLAGLEELGRLGHRESYCSIIILPADDSLLGYAFGVREELNRHGLAAEVFTEQRKPSQQFIHAERKGIEYALIVGATEKASGTVNLRDLRSRESRPGLSLEEAIRAVKGASH